MGSPSGWTPVPDVSAWKPVAGAPPVEEKPSLASDFAKYSPLGMVHAIANGIAHPIDTAKAIGNMPAENAKILDKAKESYDKGHYGEAALHFLNYLNPVGAGMEDASADFQKGDVAHGLAKTAGLATSLVAGAKAPEILDAATDPALPGKIADTAAKAGTAVKEGVKAAAPDVAAGGAKIAVGTVLPKIPGVQYGLEYAGGKQVLGGLKKGVDAFKSALSDKVAAIAETSTQEAELLDGLSQSLAGKKFQALDSTTQKYIRDLAAVPQTKPPVAVAPESAPTAAAAPAPQAAPPPQAAAPQGPVNTFVPGGPVRPPLAAPAPAAAPVAAAPAAIPDNVTPQQLGRFPAKQAADWLAKRNGVFGPYDTPAGNELVPEKAAPPKSVAEQLRDEMIRTGNASPEHLLPPEEQGGDLKTGLRDMMREVPQGAHKAVANANYAGNQEPETAGAVYEAAARADKANKLADALHKGGIPASDAVRMDAEHWEMLSKSLGLKVPSKASIGEALFRLQRLEAAASKPTTGATIQ